MSATSEIADLKHTPFHEFHVERGAKMVPYAGWAMPLLYRSVMEEHRHVRQHGGLFDVSHMGRLRFTGRDATRFLDRMCTRRVDGMAEGQARYSLVCNEEGGCRDDVLVYRLGESEYLVVCNAANRAKILAHVEAIRGDLVFKVRDETEETAMVAVQGPEIMPMMAEVSESIAGLKRYRFVVKELFGAELIVSRTGYTGEDGVEIIMPAGFAKQAVDLFLKEQDEISATVWPIGLGARDTLRLEAGMPLYGHELNEETDPLSAGLTFAVSLEKGEGDAGEVEGFVGQAALKAVAEAGPREKLVGLKLEGRRAARQGATVLREGEAIGGVTSGCLSPTLEESIAMAYVPSEIAREGEAVTVDLGRARVEATVVGLPFYKAGR